MGRNGELPPSSAAPSVNRPVAIPAPVVFCPFPPRCSPYADALTRFAVRWATRHGFVTDATSTAAFARSRFARLVGRVYPDASPPDLHLAMCVLTLVVMLDDHLETVLGREPERQRRAAAEMLAFLDRPPPEAPWPASRALTRSLGWPLAGAVADVWARISARTALDWRRRFVAHVGGYLAANAWEADNRRNGWTPTVDEYTCMRRDSSATELFFDLIEVVGNAALTPRALADPRLADLRESAQNAVAWFNDLVSWRKELRMGDRHNLVLVVRHELRLPPRDAVRYAVDRHDEQVRAFVAGRAALARADPDPGVRAFADGLAYWIRGNVDWSRETGRYAPPEAGAGD